MTRIPLALAFLLFSALSSIAQDQFDVPVTAELLPGWIQADGTRVAAVRLSLEPGWKTYWRTPGDAGIPPHFNWTGSKNLQSVAVAWPTPKIFDQNGLRSIGYANELVVPFTLAPKQPGQPMHLKLVMDIGICADICVPHTISFDEPLGASGTKPTPAIAAALAQRPFSAQEAGVTAATCRVEPTKDGLRIEARVTVPSAGGKEVVIIEPGGGEIWVSEAKTHRSGPQITAVSEMIHVNGGTIALDRSAIRLTVLGKNHAVDIRGCAAG